jgi:hypothetical protein
MLKTFFLFLAKLSQIKIFMRPKCTPFFNFTSNRRSNFLTAGIEPGESAPSRHPIPEQVGTQFRNMPAGDSGASRQVLVI